MNLADLQALTLFSVTPRYGRNETTLDVGVNGHGAPVAKLFKASQYASRLPLQLLVGPQLTEVAGHVNSFGAYAADRTQLGAVRWQSRLFGATRWQLDQTGLPTLVARPTGVSSLRYRFPFVVLFGRTPAANVLPFRFCFQAEDSQGFVVSRHAGIRARFTVTVDEPRLDRRLVLAAVVALNQYESGDLRQEAVDLTTNPFKD